jgi:uncharacterized protein (DUF58 family)
VIRPSLAIAVAAVGFVALSGAAGLSAVAAVLLVALILNFVAAAVSVRSTRLSAILPPTGIVGERMNWSVVVGSPSHGPVFVGADAKQRVPAEVGTTATIPVVLDRRGVYGVARLRAVSPGPLSLPLHAARFVDIDLVSPICVAPRRVANEDLLDAVLRSSVAGDGDFDRRGPSHGDPHHLRAYQPGDPARLVHWPVSARLGGLVVREPERVGGVQSVVVIVDFLDGSHRGELMLSETAWLCERLIETGLSVKLVTWNEGARASRVRSVRELDWALADADTWNGERWADESARDSGSVTRFGHVPTVRVFDGRWTIDTSQIGPAGARSAGTTSEVTS